MSSWPCTWWERTGKVLPELHVVCVCGQRTSVELWPVMVAPEETDSVHVPWSEVGRWPQTCSSCRRSIDYSDPAFERSASYRYEWANADRTATVRKLPVGALYDAFWMHEWRTGPDGRSLTCVLPNGHHWHIDSRANNCGRPDDDEHRCWVRHGEPPAIHVDKNGNTCPAGAGSIQSGDWHGFLHHGVLHV